MKTAATRVFIAVMGASMLWLLTGCEPAPPPASVFTLEGRWMNDQQHSVMDLNADGTFTISRRSETPDEMSGRYKVDENTNRVIFTTGPDEAQCPDVVGTYVYRVENRRLIFELVLDECTWRENEMIFPWTRIRPTRTGSDTSSSGTRPLP